MANKEFLEDYHRKRDFDISSEPFGAAKGKKRKDIFVIQKHAARNLHYDFRLAIDGVLKSWALPKGPSTDSGEKRLAIPTEDHPMEYADFEGFIPKGQYGGGTVMLWDAGTYENTKKDEKGNLIPMKDQLKNGHLKFCLDGKKLKGGYSLIQFEKGKDEKWLLKKDNDEDANARRNPTNTENKSVLTGRTMNQIKKDSEKEELLSHLEMKIGNLDIEISNREKVFFPEQHYTKGDLVDYYEKIAEVILPHIENRPLTMIRFPDGIEGKKFYQKDAPDYFPDWIEKKKIKNQDGTKTNYVICNDKASLVYLANQACITPHIWLSKKDSLRFPDRMIFDLDPVDEDFSKVKWAAVRLRKLLQDTLDLPTFLMTTGSRGLHIVVPLKREKSFDEVRSFAQQISVFLENKHPDALTTAIRKNKRGDKLFLDVTRNAFAQTTVAPYAVRPLNGAPVATPLDWNELEKEDIHSQSYSIQNIFRRLGSKKDPWRNIDDSAVSLGKANKKFNEIIDGELDPG